MASTIKGITIQIEGKTSGLVKSLQDVETQIKKDDAALKNLDKALELDPSNVDLLAAKEAVLADKTEAVTSKMEILQEVQKDALSDLPDDSQLTASQMAELEAEIATTNAQLEDLSSESSSASSDLADVGESADETGEQVEESAESFEGLGDAAESASEVASTALEGLATAAAAVATAAVAAAAAISTAFVEASTALITATTDTSTLADELLTLSSTTRLSTDTLQELNYAAELLDVDTSTVTGSMTKLLVKIGDAADGSESAAQKFTDLGVNIYDASGNLRSTEDIFWDAIDALGEIENLTERDAASMDLFGRSALELNPLIEAGSDAFADLAEEAHEVGYVMDSETLESFGALDDNIQRLTNIGQAVENSFGEILLPLLTEVSGEAVTLLGDFSGALSGAEGDIDSIGSIIEEFAPQVLSLVETYVPEILSIIQTVISAILPAIVSIAPQLISTVSSLLTTLANSIVSNSESFTTAFSELFGAVANAVLSLLPVIIPIAIGIIETLVNTLLSESNISLIVSCALDLITTLVESLTDSDTLSLLVTAAKTLVLGLINGLSEALPDLALSITEAASEIILALSDPEVLGQLLIGVTNLVEALCVSLVEMAPTITNTILPLLWNIAQSIWVALPDIIEMIFTIGLSYLLAKWSAILGLFGVQFEDIKGFFESFGIDITNLVESIVVNLTTWFGEAWDFVSTWFGNAIEGLGNFVADIIEWVVNLGVDIWNTLTTTATDIIDWATSLGDDLLDSFSAIADDAVNWGADIIQGIIDGISSMISSLTSSVSDVASTISDYLHFSVPKLGPLSDFDESGGDMINEFIKSMNSQRGELENALNSTASLIGADMGSYDLVTQSNINQTVDYSGGLSRIEQALTSQFAGVGGASSGTVVIPVYIGNEHIDTLVVDAMDRYNYATGGH